MVCLGFKVEGLFETGIESEFTSILRVFTPRTLGANMMCVFAVLVISLVILYLLQH